MLSPNAHQMIHASVPVLREHGETITRRFYQRLFETNPDLKNIFNMGNQQSGAQQQSLASALYAYAVNIDNQSALAPVIGRIVQKHVSLGVRAEHYPVVGENLLGAISETLGDAATPELLDAWGEAYGLLADALIEEERRIYHDKAIEPGEFRALKVTRKVPESDTITSFYLVPTDGKPLPAYRPGQYVSVALDVESLGLRQARQYSLSGDPTDDGWRISVKREAEEASQPGTVSNLLHDDVHEGDEILVGVPCGDFVLDAHDNGHLVLISAGVGITPMMSMLYESLRERPQRQVTFLHATREGSHHAMKEEVATLARDHASLSYQVCYESPAADDRRGVDYDRPGRLDLREIDPALLPKDGLYYLCGPDAFMQVQRKALVELGVDGNRIHCEVFGPALIGHLQ